MISFALLVLDFWTLRLFRQARDELKRLEGKKNNAEEAAKDAVNKANMAMRNYRKQQCKPWDGMRVNDPKKRKPDALEALVCAFPTFFLSKSRFICCFRSKAHPHKVPCTAVAI